MSDNHRHADRKRKTLYWTRCPPSPARLWLRRNHGMWENARSLQPRILHWSRLWQHGYGSAGLLACPGRNNKHTCASARCLSALRIDPRPIDSALASPRVVPPELAPAELVHHVALRRPVQTTMVNLDRPGQSSRHRHHNSRKRRPPFRRCLNPRCRSRECLSNVS